MAQTNNPLEDLDHQEMMIHPMDLPITSLLVVLVATLTLQIHTALLATNLLEEANLASVETLVTMIHIHLVINKAAVDSVAQMMIRPLEEINRLVKEEMIPMAQMTTQTQTATAPVTTTTQTTKLELFV